MNISRPAPEAYFLLGYAVLLVLLSLATGLLIRAMPAPMMGALSFTHSYWYVVGFKLLFMLTIPAVWFLRSGYRFAQLQPRWSFSPRNIAWTVAAFAAGFLLNGRYLHPIGEVLRSGQYGDSALRLVVALAMPLVSAAIPEEFYFRGLLQTRLERVWGRTTAVLLSVTLFTAWHLPTRYLLSKGVEGQAGDLGSVLLGTGAPVFIVGLVFALLYDRYRSLVPLIALHWSIDTLPTVASFFGIAY